MYVIGTAGHVDHGKSALVHALTGIDPDRLQEEKARGLTIDLGFAWLTLPSGREVSIVDVPGHERFIKNMLAGVGGIDLALLVVAADEGVMPQTREHLAIIDLLGIRSGVVAVTKADLADGDLLELVTAEVEETLRGTTLAGSPVVACSAVARTGLDHLLAAVERRLDETQPRRDVGRPRLPIDRAFTVSGFGTVVTGTLIDGSLTVGQEVEVVPGGIRSRIRGLQSHRRIVERAQPGSRTAVNLVGVAPQDLARGMVLTTPGWLAPTTAVDVRLRTVPGTEQAIRHNMELTFHTGAAEVPARVRLLDAEVLRPGDEGWAQLRLLAPVAAVRGDRFVVRTPNDTVGGGTVVDAHPKRHRRGHGPTLALLALLERGTPEETLAAELARRGPAELRALLQETGLAEEAALDAAASLVASGRALALTAGPLGPGSLLLSSASFQELADRARQVLGSYFAEHPLRSGMPKEELKSRLGLPSRVFNELLPHLLARGVLTDRGAAAGLPGREPSPTPEQQRRADAFLAALAASPYAPPSDGLPDPELLAYLEEQGRVVRVSDAVVFSAEAYREMVDRVVAAIRSEGSVTLARVRDMFGTSRKYVQALLEHLDDQRITRRVGDERVLRRPEGGPP